MKKITVRWLTRMNACISMREKKEIEKIGDPLKVITYLKKQKRYKEIIWLLSRYLKSRQKTDFAIYGAESIIDDFEKAVPHDVRPRIALIRAKLYQKNRNKENKRKVIEATNKVTRSIAATSKTACIAACACYAASESSFRLSSQNTYLAVMSAAYNNEKSRKMIQYGEFLLKEIA